MKSTLSLKLFIGAIGILMTDASLAEGIKNSVSNSSYSYEVEFAEIDSGEPGCAAVVYKDGNIVSSIYSGLADLNFYAPITQSSRFDIASLSKQFTAAIVYMAEQDGLLSHEDSLSQYFEGSPDWIKDVTIAHLLSHESGIPDYVNDVDAASALIERLRISPGIFESSLFETSLTFEQYFPFVLEYVLGIDELPFTPGSRYRYSNTGYVLLVPILEKVYGVEFRALAEQKLFRPLKLEETVWELPVTNTVTGYRNLDGSYKPAYSKVLESLGDGGVITTTSDFAKWLAFLIDKHQNDPEWSGFFANPTGESGSYYVNGLFAVDTWPNNGRMFMHSGLSLNAISSSFWILPDKNIGYFQFCNRSEFEDGPDYQIVLIDFLE